MTSMPASAPVMCLVLSLHTPSRARTADCGRTRSLTRRVFNRTSVLMKPSTVPTVARITVTESLRSPQLKEPLLLAFRFPFRFGEGFDAVRGILELLAA